jgi:thiamine biosynthesis lipoprotein
MGTVLEIRLCAPTRALGERWLDEAYAETARLERIFSSFDPHSEVSRANAGAGRGAVPVAPELVRIVGESLALGALTAGAFDVTVGYWMALWRQAATAGAVPRADELTRGAACVGPGRVRVDARSGTLALERSCVALDLGGIAKGWTLDRLVEQLRARGVTCALLDFGGSSLAALGAPPGSPSWGVAAGRAGTLRLRDQSLSVSGSLGQSVEIAGLRHGHIVDPRSGEALLGDRLALAVSGSGARAEALTKALLVLGPREGIALLERVGDVHGLLVGESGERWATRGFDAETRASAAGPAQTGAQ